MLLGGRKRVLSKINVLEVRSHVEHEVFRLRHVLSELVFPPFHALRTISDVQDCSLAWLQFSISRSSRSVGGERDRMTVHLHHEIVVDCLLGRKGKTKTNQLWCKVRIRELILAREPHRVGAVPEQTLLAVRK